MSRISAFAALLAGCALLPVSAHAQLSFQNHLVAADTGNTAGLTYSVTGDFNNDGREDIVASQFDGSTGGITYLLYLSNGDGTYDASPKALPKTVDAIGDFNHDGKLDFASDHAGSLAIYLGNGDGTFQSAKTIPGSSAFFLAAADMNHDGKTDLVAFNNGNPSTIQIWLSNGNGTFSKGQTVYPLNRQVYAGRDSFVTGDFDGDGKPDVAVVFMSSIPNGTTVQVLYGDGAGHLGSPYTTSDPNSYGDVNAKVGDVNNDGRDDIMAAPTTYDASQKYTINNPDLVFFRGNANRTLSYSTMATGQCPVSYSVADINGDGVNDLVYAKGPCNPPTGTFNLVLAPGTGSGNFGTEEELEEVAGTIFSSGVLRTTQGTKPDIILGSETSTSGEMTEFINVLVNESTGNFPGCGLSGIAEGVAICTPAASATSPVKFSVGAAGPTPMRTAAVWVDGKKVAEQLTHAFSNYSFLDASIPLATGSHAITVYGTGWDDTLQSKSFTLVVGSGGSCPPVGNGVNLCAPASGATVSSPVTVQATSNIPGKLARMEVWIDGVKKYTETSSPTLTYSISLAPGSHRFAVFAVDTVGGKTETYDYATVK